MTTYGKLGVKVWISRGVKDFSTRSDVVEIPSNRPNNAKKKGE
jgi:ribosomal protein S3